MSKSGWYTMFRGNHLNLCMSTYTFGTGVCPNRKQISYSSPMDFATKWHSFASNPFSSFSSTIFFRIFSFFCAFDFSLRGFFIGHFPLELSILINVRLEFLRDFWIDSSVSSSIISWKSITCSTIWVGDQFGRSFTVNPFSIVLKARSSFISLHWQTNPTIHYFLRSSRNNTTFPRSCVQTTIPLNGIFSQSHGFHFSQIELQVYFWFLHNLTIQEVTLNVRSHTPNVASL